ncbi:MAG: hypothetical protein SFV22_15915 [Saprospiraceae bacterium]|nr:hypothetical protein [Saprospiraceae bacterium]
MINTIDRGSFRYARQAELASFAENVLQRTLSVPEFAFMAEAVQELQTPLENYVAALANSRNRGKSEVAAKNAAQKTLVAALNKITDALEQHPDITDVAIYQAGFSPRNAFRISQQVPTPEILKVGTTGKRGELRVHLSTPPRMRLMHVCEYSLDMGQTWQNGHYRYERKFVLNGLPRGFDMLIRFRALGTKGATSEWTNPATVTVI